MAAERGSRDPPVRHVRSHPFDDGPAGASRDARHAANRIDDLRVADTLQDGEIARAVPVGVAISQLHLFLLHEAFDEVTLTFSIGQRRKDTARVAGLGSLGLGGEHAINAQFLGKRRDQKVQRAGDEDETMPLGPVSFERGQPLPGQLRENMGPDELLGNRLDRRGLLSLEIEFSFAKRVQGERRKMPDEMAKASKALRHADDAAFQQIAEEPDFDRDARNQRVVDVEKGGQAPR